MESKKQILIEDLRKLGAKVSVRLPNYLDVILEEMKEEEGGKAEIIRNALDYYLAFNFKKQKKSHNPVLQNAYKLVKVNLFKLLEKIL